MKKLIKISMSQTFSIVIFTSFFSSVIGLSDLKMLQRNEKELQKIEVITDAWFCNHCEITVETLKH